MWGCMCWTGPFKFRWSRGYIYNSSYYHNQIGRMTHLPLFRVRSWNNSIRWMSFYIFRWGSTSAGLLLAIAPPSLKTTKLSWLQCRLSHCCPNKMSQIAFLDAIGTKYLSISSHFTQEPSFEYNWQSFSIGSDGMAPSRRASVMGRKHIETLSMVTQKRQSWARYCQITEIRIPWPWFYHIIIKQTLSHN